VPGEKLLGYDIGCAFKTTISQSKLVSPNFRGRCTMNAWHGSVHIRKCQCANLPHYLPGTGLANLEDCERFFSQCNHCATLSRHATIYHRHEGLDSFFSYHNWSRYAILEELEPPLKDVAVTRGWDGRIFQSWLDEERAYLESVGKEPTEDKTKFLYIDALEKWWQAEYVL
jgi:hypothetical protein